MYISQLCHILFSTGARSINNDKMTTKKSLMIWILNILFLVVLTSVALSTDTTNCREIPQHLYGSWEYQPSPPGSYKCRLNVTTSFLSTMLITNETSSIQKKYIILQSNCSSDANVTLFVKDADMMWQNSLNSLESTNVTFYLMESPDRGKINVTKLEDEQGG